MWLWCDELVDELSSSGFESRCGHLSLRYGACFEEEVPGHSGKTIDWIHSGTCMWHDNKIQSNAPYR